MSSATPSAYPLLPKHHHPDVGGSRELWDEIQAAYETFESSKPVS